MLKPNPIEQTLHGYGNHPKSSDNNQNLLSYKPTGFFLVLFFWSVLLIWLACDQTVPGFDPAWHSIWSSNVKRFLTHFKEWSPDNLLALVRQHFGYPSFPWFLNGFIKVICNNIVWGDKLCLLIQYAALLCSAYVASILAFKSRPKANSTVIVLASCPLICGLAHLPFIDLLHTASFACLVAVLYWREENRSWLRTALLALVFGAYCCTKQIAMLYGAPAIAFLFFRALVRKEYKECFKLSLIGLSGLLFLLSWILPNIEQLKAYNLSRGRLGSSFAGRLEMVGQHLRQAMVQIYESISSPLLIAFLLVSPNSRFSENLKSLAVVACAVAGGVILVLTLCYYNTPEPRYFGPVIVFFSMLMGGALGDWVADSSTYKRYAAGFMMIAATLMMLLLCFSQAPSIKSPTPKGVSPVFDLCGIKTDNFLRTSIACDTRKDPWKQSWIFDTIEKIENQRYVWLNVLPSTWEYNPGSLGYIAMNRKSHIIPISWRKCNPDMTDSFTETTKQASWVDWFIIKTGYNGSKITSIRQQALYEDMRTHVEQSGDFILISQTELPDKSLLKLYRRDYVKKWKSKE